MPSMNNSLTDESRNQLNQSISLRETSRDDPNNFKMNLIENFTLTKSQIHGSCYSTARNMKKEIQREIKNLEASTDKVSSVEFESICSKFD